MKTADIKVGEHYAYVENPGSRYRMEPEKVVVLEVGVPRRRSSSSYWRARERPLNDGIRCKVVDPRYKSYEVVARPAQIVSTWAEVEERRSAYDALIAEQQAQEARAAENNQSVLATVQAALLEKGIDPDAYCWKRVFQPDASFVANSASVSVSLSLEDLAKLLGVEGDVVSPHDVEVKA